MSENLGNLGNYGVGIEIHLDALTAALEKMTEAVNQATSVMISSFDKMSVKVASSTKVAADKAEENLKKVSEVAKQLSVDFGKPLEKVNENLHDIVDNSNKVKEAVKGSEVSFTQATKAIRETDKEIDAQNKLLKTNLELVTKLSSQGGLGSSKYQKMLANTAPTASTSMPDLGGMLANALNSSGLVNVETYTKKASNAVKVAAIDYQKAAERIKQAGLAEKSTIQEVVKALELQAEKTKLLSEASQASGSSISQLNSMFKNQAEEVQKNIGFFEKLGKTMLTTLRYMLAYKAINMFTNSVGETFDLYKNLELTNVQFKVLLGNSQAATALFDSLVEYARNTVYEVDNVTKSANILLASGLSAKNILPVMQKLGDLSMGSGEKLEGLSQAFGRVALKGRANMMQLNQFISRGIPIMEALAQVMNKTTAEVTQMSRKNQIGFSDMAKALDLLTQKGGRFYGMTKEQGGTTAGILNQIGENSKLAGTSLLNLFDPAIKVVLKSLLDFVNAVKSSTDYLVAYIKQHPKVIEATKLFVEALGVLIATLVIVKTQALAGMIMSLKNLAVTIWTVTLPAIGAFIASIGWIPALIAVIAASLPLMYAAWKNNFGNIQNIIKDAGQVLYDFGQILWGVATHDFDKMKEGYNSLMWDANTFADDASSGAEKVKKSFKGLFDEFKKGTKLAAPTIPDAKGLNLAEIEDATGDAGGRGKRNASSLTFDKTVENIKEELRKKHQAAIDALEIAEKTANEEDIIRKKLIADGISEYSDYFKQLLSLIMDKKKKEQELEKEAEELKVSETNKINTEAEFKIRQIKESNLKNQAAAIAEIEKNKALAIKNTEKTIYNNLLTEKEALNSAHLAKVERMKKESNKKIAQEELDLQIKIDSMKLNNEIDTIESINNFALARGAITQQEFLRRDLELQKKRQELALLEPTKRMENIEKIDPNYKNNITYKNLEAEKSNITQQEGLKTKQIEQQILLERDRNYKEFFNSINGSFSQSIGNFIAGTEYWTDTVSNLFGNLQQAFANLIANMIKDWIVGHVTMDAITSFFTGKKIAGNAAITASNAAVTSSNAAVAASEAVIGSAASVSKEGLSELTKQMWELAASSLILAVTMPLIAISTLVMGLSAMMAALGMWLLAGAMSTLVPLSLIFVPFAILMAAEFAVIGVAAGVLAVMTMMAAVAFKALAVAAAAASAAMIPFVGWAIAPAAAIATGAAISLGARVPGFDKGAMQIPKDMVAQLHQDETVLPKPFADDFRASLKGQGNKKQQKQTVINMTVNALDAKSFENKIDDMTDRIAYNLGKRDRRFV